MGGAQIGRRRPPGGRLGLERWGVWGVGGSELQDQHAWSKHTRPAQQQQRIKETLRAGGNPAAAALSLTANGPSFPPSPAQPGLRAAAAGEPGAAGGEVRRHCGDPSGGWGGYSTVAVISI